MSVLRYSLITFPIHHYSHKKYYERHDKYVEKEKKRYWSCSFEELSEENKRTWEQRWWWPPWKYNDIVGFLEVGMDIGDHMTANIFFKRKYLPKDDPGKLYGDRTKSNDIIYFCEVSKIPVEKKDNKYYIDTLTKILDSAKRTIKKRNRYFEIFFPSYDLDCYDFMRAHEQLREKAKYK